MGTYHEYRAPQGEPADGEHDVWLDSGEVIWGHWDATTSAWVVDATADSSGLVGVQGPDGDPCPTGGEADTLDGRHVDDFLLEEDFMITDPWHIVGDTGEPVMQQGWTNSCSDNPLRFRKITGGMVEIRGIITHDSSIACGPCFLPEGYRPEFTFKLPYNDPSFRHYLYPYQSESYVWIMPTGEIQTSAFNTAYPGVEFFGVKFQP